MKHVGQITEHEMISTFLKAEIASKRFAPEIVALLKRDGRRRSIVERPDTGDAKENDYRKRLLGDFRGYGRDRSLFRRFPRAVTWHRYLIGRGELRRVKYIYSDYWCELSSGSRSPSAAARNIRAGRCVFGQSTRWHLELARALEGGSAFPELMLVGAAPDSGLVLLEGHARLTAYFLTPARIPAELSVILGFSPEMSCWAFF